MNPLKHKMANEWMRQEDASPEEALNTWDAMEAEFKANRVGTPTEEVTQFDRRIYETPEGERVSEKSTTFFLNGQWMNVPTIHNGRSFTDDQLRFMIKQGKIEPTSVHGSRNEAEEAAASRSNMMKSHIKGFDEGGRIGLEPGGSAALDMTKTLGEASPEELTRFKKHLTDKYNLPKTFSAGRGQPFNLASQSEDQIKLLKKLLIDLDTKIKKARTVKPGTKGSRLTQGIAQSGAKQKILWSLKDYNTYGDESLDALTESMFEGKKYYELGTKDKTAVKRKFRNKLKDLAEGKGESPIAGDEFKKLYNESLNNHPNVKGRPIASVPEGKLTQAKTMAAEDALSKLPKKYRSYIVDNVDITLRDVDTTGGIPKFKQGIDTSTDIGKLDAAMYGSGPEGKYKQFVDDVTEFYKLPRGTGGGEFSYARDRGLSIKDFQKKYFPDLGEKRVEQLVTGAKNKHNLPDHPTTQAYEKEYGKWGKKEETRTKKIRKKLDPQGFKGADINPLKKGSGWDLAHSIKAGIMDPDVPGPQFKKETIDTIYPLKEELNRQSIANTRHTAAENALTKIHNDRMKLMEQVEGDNFRIIPGQEDEFAKLQAKGKKIAREFSYADELFGTEFKGLPGTQQQVRGTVNFQVFQPDEKGIYKPENTKLVGGDTEKSLAKGLRETPLAKKDIAKLTKADRKIATDNALKIFKDIGINCTKKAGGQCNSMADYRKSFNELVQKAAAGDKPAVGKMVRFTKAMRGLKGAAAWTGYGLLAEVGFMVPFAVGDYAAGESWKRILGNATDWGFGPMLGQSEQEEFLAALPEGSKAVEGEKVLELGKRLTGMGDQKVNPGYGRVGFEEKAPKQRQKVYTDILEDYNLNLQPFMKGPAGQFLDESIWTQAHEDAADTRARIAKEKLERLQKRRDEGTIAQEDWMVGGDTRGYASGGIMNLKKK